jgi:methionyl-tRNA formyltransferase
MIRIVLTTNPLAKDISCVTDIINANGGEIVTIVTAREQLETLFDLRCDLIISDRTAFLFPIEFSSGIRVPIWNTHPSLLPFYRGSQPLFFCVCNGDPHGVTIHLVDQGVDTGPVLWQEHVPYDGDDTFRQVYDRSRRVMLGGLGWVLKEQLQNGQVKSHHQLGFNLPPYKMAEFRKKFDLMPLGWDTRISEAQTIFRGNLD